MNNPQADKSPTPLNGIPGAAPFAGDTPLPTGLRPKLTRGVGQLFAPPYLPHDLIGILALLILTEAAASLIDQSPEYWLNYSRAHGSDLIRWLLNMGPLVLVASYLVYAAIVALILALINYRAAIVPWSALTFYHLVALNSWAKCGPGKLVDFGGNTGLCSVYRDGLMLILAAVVGLALANTVHPPQPAVLTVSRRRRFPRPALALSALWIFGLTAAVLASSRVPETGWRPLVANHYPAGRIGGMIAYDSGRQKAVMFGGATAWYAEDVWAFQNDTWEWDGNDWAEMSPGDVPPARIAHSMAFDKARGVTVLFGGYNQDGTLSDTWEWDGQNWHLHCPACSPPDRQGHVMIYDEQRGLVVLYGGFDGVETFFNDAWEWDGEDWSRIELGGPTPMASGYAMVYDATRSVAVALLSGYPGGTWIWQGNQWSRPPLAPEPPTRTEAGITFEPVHGQAILFGGSSDAKLFSDTWIYDGSQWSELKGGFSPTERWGSTLFYDAVRQRVVLFGGFGDETYYNQMWELVLPDG